MCKTVVLIDAGYLVQAGITLLGYRPKFDYSKLIQEFTKDRSPLLRTYFYDCLSFCGTEPTAEELARRQKQKKFHDYLQTLPQFECRFGRLKKYSDESGNIHFEQKKVDVMFAIDLVKLSARHLIDRAVLVTGDLDMLPAIESAKSEGVIVELYFARGYAHQDLLRGVDITHEITKDWFNDMIVPFYKSSYSSRYAPSSVESSDDAYYTYSVSESGDLK